MEFQCAASKVVMQASCRPEDPSKYPRGSYIHTATEETLKGAWEKLQEETGATLVAIPSGDVCRLCCDSICFLQSKAENHSKHGYGPRLRKAGLHHCTAISIIFTYKCNNTHVVVPTLLPCLQTGNSSAGLILNCRRFGTSNVPLNSSAT